MSLSTTQAGRGRRMTTSVFAILAMIAVSACSDGESAPASTDPLEPEIPQAEALPAEALPAGTLPGAPLELPVRKGPRRQTSGSVPHVQLGAEPVPVVDAELRRRAFQLPGVENLASDRSLPGARGLALSADLELTRADVIAGSREFAHIHPDGSLHVWLAVDSAVEVEDKKWGELHPWVDREGFWEGVVMVYTPETLDELDVTIKIIVDAYNFVTGASLQPADIP